MIDIKRHVYGIDNYFENTNKYYGIISEVIKNVCKLKLELDLYAFVELIKGKFVMKIPKEVMQTLLLKSFSIMNLSKTFIENFYSKFNGFYTIKYIIICGYREYYVPAESSIKEIIAKINKIFANNQKSSLSSSPSPSSLLSNDAIITTFTTQVDKLRNEINNLKKEMDNKFSQMLIKEKKLEDLVNDVASENNKLCLICMENIKEIVFVSCGHLVCCKICSDKLTSSTSKCPLCCGIIKQAIKIYNN